MLIRFDSHDLSDNSLCTHTGNVGYFRLWTDKQIYRPGADDAVTDYCFGVALKSNGGNDFEEFRYNSKTERDEAFEQLMKALQLDKAFIPATKLVV